MPKIKLKELFSLINDNEYVKIVLNSEVLYYGISKKRFSISNYDILKNKAVDNIVLENNVKDTQTKIFFKPYMWIYLEN